MLCFVVVGFMLFCIQPVLAGVLPYGENIAVVVYEKASDLSRPGLAIGTAESIIKQALIQNGYKLVNESQLERIKRSKAAILALQGNAEAIMKLGRKYSVSIFVVGKATLHVPRLNPFGSYTGTAAISLQVYRASDGRYIFSDVVRAKELGYTQDEAAQKALEAAAHLAAQRLIGGIASTTGNEGGVGYIPSASSISIVISNVTNFSDVNQVVYVLNQFPRVTSAKVTSYGGGRAVITVVYKGSASQLADGLRRKSLPMIITGVSGNQISAQMQ